MAQLDALRLVEVLRQRVVDLATSDQFVRDEKLAAVCRNIWAGPPDRGGLVSDLWVEGAFPSESAGVSLRELAMRGLFDRQLCQHLDKNGAFPADLPLYTHQFEAVKEAQILGQHGERPALVVTAGTGSGKTESFLLPVLNDLFRQVGSENKSHRPAGVKCIILYPMNALVNDQVERLTRWLSGQDSLTFFHFTSETPEDKKDADRQGLPTPPEWPTCRYRTRRQARGLEDVYGNRFSNGQIGPVPDILVTNYSMLEYMLCRPQDAVFFGPALRAIVLDEAHLYTGTLAAEITLLLRRVYTRCGVAPEQVLQIATSATLGTDEVEELREFAATLFSKPKALVRIIQGKTTRIPMPAPASPEQEPTPEELVRLTWVDCPLVEMSADGKAPRLVRNAELCQELRSHLPILVSREIVDCLDPTEDRPAVLLHHALRYAPLVHRLSDLLWEMRRCRLEDLTDRLWARVDKTTLQATILLLRLAASARTDPGKYPLIPHRLHLMVRPPMGMVICVNPNCTGPEEHRITPTLGAVQPGNRDRCVHCGGATLSLYRCTLCGEWVLAGIMQDTRYWPSPCPNTASEFMTLAGGNQGVVTTLDPVTGTYSGYGGAGVPVRKVDTCPNCGSDKNEFQPLIIGDAIMLPIVVETVLSELPEFPGPQKAWLPARGRRLLVFSDSRQEAARLGPHLTRQHEIQVVRAALVKCLSEATSVRVMRRLLQDIEQIEQELQEPGLDADERRYLQQQLKEKRKKYEQYKLGGSISDWAGRLAGEKLLSELLDPETSESHTVETWSEEAWEHNREQVKRRVTWLLGSELARGVSPLERLGMAEITYPGLDDLDPPEQLLGILPKESQREQLAGCWPDFLRSLCDSLRIEGVVTLGQDDSDREFPHGSFLIGRWAAEVADMPGKLISFVGKSGKHRRRRFAQAVLEACGLSAEAAEKLAPELLKAAFQQLLSKAVAYQEQTQPGQLAWLQRSTRQTKDGPPANAIRIVFPELGLRKPQTLYRCQRTGRLWPRSVLGCALEPALPRTLVPVTEAEIDGDPRIQRERTEYSKSKVFHIGLWAEEHSAQRSPKDNRRLQDLFKAGIRNVLSATTTLELGIDIGGLNGVLIGNVPPGKANYLQRAGRAGRRADGSSVVVTYARPRPFDQEVFRDLGRYLDRPLRRPRVFMERHRVVRRHLHAFLLGEFFRAIYPAGYHVGAMHAFGRMGQFAGVPFPPKWEKDYDRPQLPPPDGLPFDKPVTLPWWRVSSEAALKHQFINFLKYIETEGEELFGETVRRLFAQTALEQELSNWQALMETVRADFEEAMKGWEFEYSTLLDGWREAKDRRQANAIRYQLSALYELTVIEALADRQFLPRYGFPIGVQRLRVVVPDEYREGRVREEDQYRLERRSLLALREYVPGSQLLVGGKLVTSHGLLKHWTGANIDKHLGLRGKWTICENKHFYYWVTDPLSHCPICGAERGEKIGDLLFPVHGFSSAAWDPPRRSTDVERIGHAETATMSFGQASTPRPEVKEWVNFGGLPGLRVQYRESGELLVYNRGDHNCGFAVCLKCGYAESEQHDGTGTVGLPSSFVNHAPLDRPNPWIRCWSKNEAPVLRNQVLAARETTDVLLLDFSGCLAPTASRDEAVMTTLGHALLRAGADLLDLDTRELGFMRVPVGEGGKSHGIVLYDNVPGGAGHVRELVEYGRLWLEKARDVMYVNPQHHATCKTACLDCLLSFTAQEEMSRNLLVRERAWKVLCDLLDGQSAAFTTRSEGADDDMDAKGMGVSDRTSKPLADVEVRLRRARERLKARRVRE